jgi:hypothetical protein
MLVLALVVLSACTREERRPIVDMGDAALASRTASLDAGLLLRQPSETGTSRTAEDGGPRAETPQEKLARERYRDSMTKGRTFTLAARYDQAAEAFEHALEAKPNDSRALAEMGYARLLSGKDPTAAQADLDKAAANTKDPKLLSQIFYHLGLAEEKLHETDNALTDFWVANKLAPNNAAQRKIAGKHVCPVRVDRAFTAGWPEKTTVTANGWLALSKELPATSWDNADSPKSDDEARLALAGDGAGDTFPMMIVAGHRGQGRAAFVVSKAESGLRAVAVGAEIGGRCPGDVSFRIVSTRGNLVHVHGNETPEGGYAYMCGHTDDAGLISSSAPCTDAELAADGQPKQSFCAGGTATARDVVVDTRTGKALVALERPVWSDKGSDLLTVSAALSPSGLTLDGLDCTGTTIPLTAPDAGTTH